MSIPEIQNCYIPEENPKAVKTQIVDAFQKLPPVFIPNAGQKHPQVWYYSKTSGCEISFTTEDVVFAFVEQPPCSGCLKKLTSCRRRNILPQKEQTAQGFALYLRFVGANPAIPEGQIEGAGQVSYFTGSLLLCRNLKILLNRLQNYVAEKRELVRYQAL